MHQSWEQVTGWGLNVRVACILVALILLTGFRGRITPEELVQHVFTAETQDQTLEDILFLTIGVELAKNGFSSTRLPDGARYILEIAYDSRGTEADVSFMVSRSDDAHNPLARISFILSIDYSIDSQIAAEVNRLLDTAGMKPEDNGSTKAESAIQGLFSPQPAKEIIPEEMSPEELQAITALKFEASLMPGGVFFIGKATDYFRYGAITTLGIGLRKPWKFWSLSAGVQASGLRAFNENGVTGGPLYISTVGANIHIGTGYSSSYLFSVDASGGVAVITVMGDKIMNKAVPFADGGVSIQLPVMKTLFVGFDIQYLMVFDKDILIMGMVPALSLKKEL